MMTIITRDITCGSAVPKYPLPNGTVDPEANSPYAYKQNTNNFVDLHCMWRQSKSREEI
jgi:hypothetical protein